jgi:hypothetical protein
VSAADSGFARSEASAGLRAVVLLFLAVLTVAALLNGYFVPIAGRRVRPEHVAGPLVFLAFVAWQLWRRQKPIRLDAFALLAAAWVLVNAVSSWAFAPDKSDSFVHVIRMGFLAVSFVTVANLPPFNADHWVSRVRVWLALNAAALAYGLGIWFLARYADVWLPGMFNENGVTAFGVRGTQLERNLLGILAATIALVAGYSLAARWAAPRVAVAPSGFLGSVCVLAFGVLVVSLTRSAWVAAVAAGPMAYLAFDRGWIPRIDRPLLATILAMPVFFGVTYAAIRALPAPDPSIAASALAASAPAENDDMSSRLSTLKSLDTDFTLNTRLQDAKWAFEDWRASPWLGRGTGSFLQIHGIRVGTEAWISNLILHTMVDTGLVGLLIQMTLFGLVTVRAWRMARAASDLRLAVALKAMALGLLVMFIAYQLTDGTWLAVFWIHLGLMVNGIYCASEVARQRPEVPVARPLRAGPG